MSLYDIYGVLTKSVSSWKNKSSRASERSFKLKTKKKHSEGSASPFQHFFQVFFLYYNSVVHYYSNTINLHANTSFTQPREELFMAMQLFPGTKWDTFTTTSDFSPDITALPLMTIPLLQQQYQTIKPHTSNQNSYIGKTSKCRPVLSNDNVETLATLWTDECSVEKTVTKKTEDWEYGSVGSG